MTDLDSVIAKMSQDIHFSEKEASNETTVDVNARNIVPEELQCFVCDAKVQGKHYALATCRTQSTRTRVIEKLGELVGERYMVVISEDDVICRSCANLINTLDRLESEMKGVKTTVLRYLERKYYLDEGELLNNNELVKHSQPPQITQIGENDKKRKAVNLLDESVSKNKQKKSILLQCDKCRYTTDYNTFMVHHIRQHVNQKINCDKCGVQFMGNNQQNNSHSCKEKQIEAVTEVTDQNEVNTETPPVNINVFPMENGDLTEDLTVTHDPNISIKEDQDNKVFDLPNLEADDITPQYVVPESNEEFLMQEQDIDDNLKPTILPVADSNKEILLHKKSLSNKQILTVAEDGSLEMMEIEAWEEKNANLKGDKS